MLWPGCLSVHRSEKLVGARRGQKEPEGARRSQEEPGGARRSQEEPGVARMLILPVHFYLLHAWNDAEKI